jgi:DNA-cytosine methyltransferase
MRYATLCSGIEAPSMGWHGLGWKPVFFSEIEPFPKAVLKHHYPNVPDYGDMTKYKEWKHEPIDLICAGTPCQSFSVAGLRKGIEDPRGNLTLTFLGVLERYRPTWVVWENVPGVLSVNNGNDIMSFVDGLQKIGYIIDIEILDAQFFGVPQRRRRVFICGKSVESIMNERTPTSLLIMAKLMLEILHDTCKERFSQLGKEPVNLEQARLLKDGLKKKMSTLDNLEGEKNLLKLPNILAEALAKFQVEAKNLDSKNGESAKERTLEELLMDFEMGNLSTHTEESLRSILEEGLKVAKSYTTSTATSIITKSQISMCFKAVLSIGRLILHLRKLSPNSFQTGLSFLTAIQDFTNYARLTNRDLFDQEQCVYDWDNLMHEASSIDFIIRHTGDWRASAAVLFEPHCLSGYPAPSREKREGVAGYAQSSIGGYRKDEVGGTIRANGGDIGGGSETFVAPVIFEPRSPDGVPRIHDNLSPTLNTMGGGQREPCVDYSIQGNTIDRADTAGANGKGVKEEQAFTLNTIDRQDVAHTFKIRSGCDGGGKGYLGQDEAAFTLDTTQSQNLMHQTAIRRLTPIECERLQGFPDNYTQIPYRNKPPHQCPDGPRYKVLGNSMAVPVLKWIGERIDQIHKYKNTNL